MRGWLLEFMIVVDIIGAMYVWLLWAPVVARFFQ